MNEMSSKSVPVQVQFQLWGARYFVNPFQKVGAKEAPTGVGEAWLSQALIRPAKKLTERKVDPEEWKEGDFLHLIMKKSLRIGSKIGWSLKKQKGRNLRV
jgi:hypothetical protein